MVKIGVLCTSSTWVVLLVLLLVNAVVHGWSTTLVRTTTIASSCHLELWNCGCLCLDLLDTSDATNATLTTADYVDWIADVIRTQVICGCSHWVYIKVRICMSSVVLPSNYSLAGSVTHDWGNLWTNVSVYCCKWIRWLLLYLMSLNVLAMIILGVIVLHKIWGIITTRVENWILVRRLVYQWFHPHFRKTRSIIRITKFRYDRIVTV